MMPNLERLSVPIEVEEVTNRNEEYFLENKTYLTNIVSEKVIYLDCDTIVVGNVNSIWKKE
jgi:lipopolysaccharide biosynthesis glycosyltransferase